MAVRWLIRARSAGFPFSGSVSLEAEQLSDQEEGSFWSAGEGVALSQGREHLDCAAVLAGVEARG